MLTPLENAKMTFAFYGFNECPLTDEELKECFANNLDWWSIGSDVASGFTFIEAKEALK